MIKKEWLNEAIEKLESMNTEEFEEFIVSCTSDSNQNNIFSNSVVAIELENISVALKIDEYRSLDLGSNSHYNLSGMKFNSIEVHISKNISCSANMDEYYANNLTMAA